MIRSLLRITTSTIRPIPLFRIDPFRTIRFDFAKVSKKEKDMADKKKEKEMVKESLGGKINEIDLNKYQNAYQQVVSSFKQQLGTIKAGRLDPASINIAQVKVGSQSYPINALAQVSAKSANTCVVSPFDSTQLEVIEKGLKIWNDDLEIKRVDNTLVLTQVAQGKDAKVKLVQRVKKLSNDRRQQLKKLRSNTQEELRKYKKVVPEDRLRVIEEEAKSLFDKENKQIDRLQKQKEKELMK